MANSSKFNMQTVSFHSGDKRGSRYRVEWQSSCQRLGACASTTEIGIFSLWPRQNNFLVNNFLEHVSSYYLRAFFCLLHVATARAGISKHVKFAKYHSIIELPLISPEMQQGGSSAWHEWHTQKKRKRKSRNEPSARCRCVHTRHIRTSKKKLLSE
jgi:hypothetical protein